ncbi:SpoIID/LytB domain-containing protein [Clostridium hydrogenum]|uniref:SpoIID/LytB domain-containing protein n=1 Tax=Clostridium hydrogenum TaxID=2855764 RepID=UPI001F177478|nr:SpoIID/LytB domain-containing protein [Clostridium hydrogenum]
MHTKKLSLISIIAAGACTFSYLTLFYPSSVKAYENTAYFSNLKIGLVSMANQVMTLKLNGDYLLNGTLLSSGTILNLSVSNNTILVNGSPYQIITLTPKAASNLVSISSGTQTNSYTGSFIFQINTGKILPIDSTSMENYLKGVVGLEMSDYFPIEALKAQAVASRTYALKNLAAKATLGYDFDDTINYQAYHGYVPADIHVMQAVDSTKGQVVTYNDALIDSVFSASHGGYTEDVKNVWGYAVPYLISKSDIYNGQIVDNSSWSLGNKVLTNANIEATLKAKGYLASTDTFVKLDLNSITRYVSGRVSSVAIIYKDLLGTTKTKFITGDKCRTFLNLQSSMWNVTYNSTNGIYTFSGKGYGHGVGMSQLGASQRASLGQTYDKILTFYYDSTTINNLLHYAKLASYSNDSTNNQIFLGQAVNYTASGSDGSGNYLYKFGVICNGQLVSETDYTSNNKFNFIPSSAGNYQLYVKIKDIYSDKDYDDTITSALNVQAIPAVSINNFNANTINALIGQQTINFANSVSGGTGLGFLYKYEISKDGTVIGAADYNTNSTFNFVPSAVGNYSATLYVKDALSKANYDSKQTLAFNIYNVPSLSNFTVDKTELLQGQGVNISAQGKDGSGSYLYKYEISKDGVIVSTRDFSSVNNFSYSPASYGDYSIKAYIKDAASTNSYDDTETIAFKVYSTPTLTNFASDKTSIILGDTVNFNAGITGGSDNPQYRFMVYTNGNLITDSLYNLSNTFSYIPKNSGTYQIYVYEKDSLETNSYSITANTLLNVFNPVTISSVTANGYMYEGKQINLTSNITGGSTSGISYKFEIYKNGTLITSNNYSPSANYSFTPSTYGNYNIKVFAKDSLTLNTFDNEKDFSITINKTPLTIATLPLKYGTTSQDVVNLQNALISLGYSISSATGYYGTQTRGVVTLIQAQNSLTQTGNVDAATLQIINNLLINKVGVKNLTFN